MVLGAPAELATVERANAPPSLSKPHRVRPRDNQPPSAILELHSASGPALCHPALLSVQKPRWISAALVPIERRHEGHARFEKTLPCSAIVPTLAVAAAPQLRLQRELHKFGYFWHARLCTNLFPPVE